MPRDAAPSAALPAAAARPALLLGVLYMAGFSVLAPAHDVSAKLAALTLPVAVVVFARFAVQGAVLAAATGAGWGRWPARADWGWHVLRGALMCGATGLFFAALPHMRVAEAVAIYFVMPLILTALAALLLREVVTPRQWAACLAGFGGVMLIVQPGFAEVGAPALYPLGTALLFALYMLLTRKLSPGCDAVGMQALAGLVGAALSGAVLIAGTFGAFEMRWPVGAEWAFLAGAGGFATLAHLCITVSLRHAPASAVAPVQYLEIAFAALYGWWVFAEAPGPLAWVGIAVVSAAGLAVITRRG